MSLFNPAIDTFLLSSLLIALGWFYVYHQFYDLFKRTSTTLFPGVVLVHSLYSLYGLIQRPPNLFSRLGIPIDLPIEHIRALLLHEAGFGRGGGDEGGLAVPVPMPDDLELLLSRLKTDESRGWFVRCISSISKLILQVHAYFHLQGLVKGHFRHAYHAPPQVTMHSSCSQAQFSHMYAPPQCYYYSHPVQMGGIDGGDMYWACWFA